MENLDIDSISTSAKGILAGYGLADSTLTVVSGKGQCLGDEIRVEEIELTYIKVQSSLFGEELIQTILTVAEDGRVSGTSMDATSHLPSRAPLELSKITLSEAAKIIGSELYKQGLCNQPVTLTMVGPGDWLVRCGPAESSFRECFVLDSTTGELNQTP